MSNVAATVDSLINFSKSKKKFSFVNKSPIKKKNSYSTEVTNTDSGTQSEDAAEELADTSDLLKKSSWKGSARLKEEKSHSSSSSSEDESEKLERKKKK